MKRVSVRFKGVQKRIQGALTLGIGLQLARNSSALWLSCGSTWRGRGLSKSFISRVIIGATPFRVLRTLLISYFLSPLPLQVGVRLGFWGLFNILTVQVFWGYKGML